MNILKRKRVWFNIITGALAVVNAMSGTLIPNEISAVIIASGNIVISAFDLKGEKVE